METLTLAIKALKNQAIIGIISTKTNQVYLVKTDKNELTVETYHIGNDPIGTIFLVLKDTKNINPAITPSGADLVESLYVLGVKSLLKIVLTIANYSSVESRLTEMAQNPSKDCPVLSYDSITDVFTLL